MTVPTLEDWARMSAVVSGPPPPPWDSPMTRSATWMVGGTANCVSGVISFSSSAPEIVKALKVDPGS